MAAWKHLFYVDVVPQFGFPLAIRPRFQLNAIIRKDEDIEMMRYTNILYPQITIFHTLRYFVDELVLPFLWLQDGFSEPSIEIANAIEFGLSAPVKLSILGGSCLLVVRGGLPEFQKHEICPES